MSSSTCCFLTCIQVSRGRSGSLVFPTLSEFSTVYCDPHSQRLWHSQWSRNRCFSGTLALSMVQQMLAICSLVPLPFLNPAWTSGSSWFMYCWSLAWRTSFTSPPADQKYVHQLIMLPLNHCYKTPDYSLQYSCLENSMDRGDLVGYSLWGQKESDTPEPLTLSLC